MLKIVIDGRMYNQSGIGRYIRNLIDNLQIVDRKNEYFILHLKEDFHTLKYRENFHKIIADFKWYGIAEQIKLLGFLKSLKPNLVHFPHFNIPIFYQGKFVVTIHDLIHQHFSMQRATTHGPLVYKFKQLGYRRIFKSALKKSEKIIVPSNFIKEQLKVGWKIEGDKIIVTHEAVDNKIASLVKEVNKDQIKKVMKKFSIASPYLFYVGNAHPHKNIEGLIRVFRELREKYPDLSLVLSGGDHYFWQRIKQKYQDKGIIYTGQISDQQLVALYKQAACFVMPSLEEGFGIPILEAMSCSCPVISSSAGSLPEVGGDAVLYFDPGNQEDMGNKLNMVLESGEIREKLIEKGLQRYKQFSWQKLAKQTLEVYSSCVLH